MYEEELVSRALKTNIKVYPLSYYIMENHYESQPIIVLGFAGIPEKDLQEAINLLLKAWQI